VPPGDLGDRLSDVGIGAATTDVTAHAFSELGVRELWVGVQIVGDVTGDASLDFVEPSK
jgi:hypothetical protein